MIKAVVFDYGGVISFQPAASAWEEIACLGGIDAATLDRFAGQFRGEYDRGTFSCEDYYRKVLAAAGAPPESFERACIVQMAALDEAAWSHLNPGTVRLMEDVKQAGYTLGILSNMAEKFLFQIRTQYPSEFGMPDVSIFSCEVNLIKPERAIYEALLGRLACEAAAVVFFDDVPVNVEAARALGIKAYLWQTAEAARATLRELGVTV